jgi:5'-3' exonuclease
MGIEQFYFAIKRKFEDIGESINNGKTLEQELSEATYVYIDFNAIVHKVSEKVVFEKNIESLNLLKKDKKEWKKFVENTNENLEKIIITRIIKDLEDMINLAKRAKEFYIAFDGMPELSKCVEQKHRKMMGYIKTEISSKIEYIYDKNKSQKYRDEEHELFQKNKISFSKNKITQHSDFMHNLSDDMKKKFKNLNEIVISDVEEYGEGEKKIVYRIFNENVNINNDDNILIFSPDADVIQLASIVFYKFGLQNIFPKIFVYNKDLIDIYNFASYITNMIYQEEINDNFKKIMLLKDFICIFTFFGNDFLPKIVSLSNVYDNIDVFIDIYKKVMKNNFGKMINMNGIRHEINLDYFKMFLEELAMKEPIFYKKYIDTKKMEETDRFQISYYDCAKYVMTNEYYFFYYIEYFNKNILPEYFLLPKHKKDESPVKKIIELLYLKSNDNLKIDSETQNCFLNFIEQNKNNFSMKNIGLIKFVDDDYKLLLYDFDLIAFGNKKSAWKFILNEFGYKNEEQIKTQYNHSDVRNYLDGFLWVLDWYFDRMMHPISLTKISTWFYPNHNSPFIKHIVDYINVKKITTSNMICDLMTVRKEFFLTKEEHKIYTEPSDYEKQMLEKYIDKVIRILYNSNINYVMDKNYFVENKLKKNGWDGKIIFDCHHAKYFEKCHMNYKIYSFKDFTKKFRQTNQNSGNLIMYKHKYYKYKNKIKIILR